jgi:BlaI family penicillinase repressor
MQELTKAEEQIMMVYWEIGPAFVKEVIEKLPAPKPAYNTVSTIVRILEKKEVLAYKAFGKTHQYYPLFTLAEYRKRTMKNVLGKFFSNSYQSLVAHLVNEKDISLEDLEELLTDLKEKKNG